MTDIYDTDFLARLTVKRLSALNQTRAKVQAMERRAGALEEEELERRKLAILAQLSDRYNALGPDLRDMHVYVGELKQHLQSVHDADLLGDPAVQALTTQHCIGYTIRLVDLVTSDGNAGADRSGSAAVLELAASTLAMFSGRRGGGGGGGGDVALEALLDAGGMNTLVTLLSPLLPMAVVVNAVNVAGNVADDASCRLALRTAGAIGALVRLLRPDVETPAQTAAAAALSLLAARDVVIQDSVRYLGGIDLLVDLLAAGDAYLNEVARYCLLSLRQGNLKNQAEIITAIRANTRLSRSVMKLNAASDLLRFEERTPSKAPSTYHRSVAEASSVRNLIERLDFRSSLDRPPAAATATRSSIYGEGVPPPLSSSPARSSVAAASGYNLTPPPAVPYRRPSTAAGSSYRRSTLDAAMAAAFAIPSTRSPIRSSFEYAPTASARKYSSLVDPLLSSSPLRAGGGGEEEYRLSASLVEVESELLRKKHLARFTSEEVCLLLEEMGFDRLDLRGFRVHKVDGGRLLEMTEDEMALEMVLPRLRIRTVQQLQRAVRLFDRIATLPRQGRISEIELRLYLAGQGASSPEVAKILKLIRTLVRTDRFDFITFWDFVTSYNWLSQALRIYNIAC